jgi:hypothetical protein
MAVTFHAGERDGRPNVIARGVRYDDTFARRDGRWLFVARRHRAGWQFEVAGSAEPTQPPPLAR